MKIRTVVCHFYLRFAIYKVVHYEYCPKFILGLEPLTLFTNFQFFLGTHTNTAFQILIQTEISLNRSNTDGERILNCQEK
jgi:hypothetical protein